MSEAADASCLADGTPMDFWDDRTQYRAVYHVDRRHGDCDDANPGTPDRPWATIGRAAQALQPGEKVVIHEGVYCEQVRPARGGTGSENMIAYEAAPGETVVVRGSRLWRPEARPSRGWSGGRGDDGITIWMAELPAEWFVGYNPFGVRNMPAEFQSYGRGWSKRQLRNALKYRGMIFDNDRPLQQASRYKQLAEQSGAFWVEEPGLVVHFRLADDADPAVAELAVTVHEQVLGPRQQGLGYLRISGLVLEHAADGVPVPQRALLSAARGHHWIIEDNVIRHANACGMDLGRQDWKAAADAGAPPDCCGRHVVRRNVISDCGICGIAGAGGMDGTLIEDNTLEGIGGLDMEALWESAAVKIHFACGCLIRRNVFRHIRHAAGIWLDCMNHNTRLTGNVLADIEGQLGAIFLEGTRRINRVDSNVIWNVRPPAEPAYPPGGIVADSGDNIIADHNLVAGIEPPDGADLENQHGYAVAFSLVQSGRIVEGRVGICHGNSLQSNLIAACRRRVLLGRREGNDCDGNLYDSRHDAGSLCVGFPRPPMAVNLAAWQDCLGMDRGGAQAELDISLDADTLELTIQLTGAKPSIAGPVGPLSDAQWRQLLADGRVTFHIQAGAEHAAARRP